jgi:hypothetical protein
VHEEGHEVEPDGARHLLSVGRGGGWGCG